MEVLRLDHMMRYEDLIVFIAHLGLHEIGEKASRFLKFIVPVQLSRRTILNLHQSLLILNLFLFLCLRSLLLVFRVLGLFLFEEFGKHVLSIDAFGIFDISYLSLENR